MTPTDLKAAARRIARAAASICRHGPAGSEMGWDQGAYERTERAALVELTRLDAYHTERYLDLIETKDAERERAVREERERIAQMLDGEGQPGYATAVRFLAHRPDCPECGARPGNAHRLRDCARGEANSNGD